MCAGLGLALWPLGQRAYGLWTQRALRQSWQRAWEAEERRAGTEKTRSVTAPASRSRSFRGRRPSNAEAKRAAWLPTRIVIPSLDLDAVVTRGVGEAALRAGPGHDPASALPGQKGNCVIAAHRNAYGWWFYGLNRLGSGARIELLTPRATHVYAVASTRVLPDTATWALRAPRHPHAAPRLTLYTCALPHGSRRIVVTASLVGTHPRKAPST